MANRTHHVHTWFVGTTTSSDETNFVSLATLHYSNKSVVLIANPNNQLTNKITDMLPKNIHMITTNC